jgi:predicted RNA-binding protein
MNDLVNMLDGVGIGIDVGKQLILLKLKDKFHFITNADATSSNLCSSSSVSAMRAISSTNNKQLIS